MYLTVLQPQVHSISRLTFPSTIMLEKEMAQEICWLLDYPQETLEGLV